MSPAQRRDRIRRRAGAAYARLQCSGDRIASALGLHKSGITHRKRGQGHFAAVLVELDLLERDSVDTTPLLTAIIETIAAARCGQHLDIRALELREIETDAAEQVAQDRYRAGVGTREEWRRQLAEYIGVAQLFLVADGGR
ncbi:MAG: hypothetical protein M0R75_01605 [Dehalococcoidia bacterium]|nr:hypothetical protein [Dehalococcoidia bacterium]